MHFFGFENGPESQAGQIRERRSYEKLSNIQNILASTFRGTIIRSVIP